MGWTRSPNLSVDDVRAQVGDRARRAGRAFVLAQPLSNVISIGGTILIMRQLQAEDAGIVQIGVVVMTLLTVWHSLGLVPVTVQKEDLSADEFNVFFWVNFLFASLLGALMALSSPLLAHFFDEPRVLWIAAAIALVFPLNGIAVQHHALLQRRMDQGQIALAGFAAAGVSTVAAVVCAYAGWGAWALVVRLLVEPAAMSLILWSRVKWLPRRPKWSALNMSSIKVGANVTGTSLLLYLSRNVDSVIVARAFGTHALGLYSLSYRFLLMPVSKLTGPVDMLATPALSRLQNEPERYRAAFFRVLEKYFILVAALGAFFFVNADLLVVNLFGEQWAGAAAPLKWLALVIIVQAITDSPDWLFISQDRSSDLVRWFAFSAAVDITAFVIGAFVLGGIEGVALAFLCAVAFVRLPGIVLVAGRKGPVRVHHFAAFIARFAYVPLGLIGSLTAARAWLAGLEGGAWASLASGFPALFVVGVVAGLSLLALLAATPWGRGSLSDLIHFAFRRTKAARASGEQTP